METMNKCPHTLRPGLPTLPPRIAALPVDGRGFHIPYFVAMVDGEPDFRFADGEKRDNCMKFELCWICGQTLGHFKTFPVGPMCAVNRNTAEPPSHLDCALWAVKACPFLNNPKAVRRGDELTEANKANVAGIMIERNPGVTCVWTTPHFTRRDAGGGKWLFDIGSPESVSWWKEGRPATRAEVQESLKTGMPALEAVCHSETDLKALFYALAITKKLLPES